MSNLFRVSSVKLSLAHFPSSGQHFLLLQLVAGIRSWNTNVKSQNALETVTARTKQNPAQHFVVATVAITTKLTNIYFLDVCIFKCLYAF